MTAASGAVTSEVSSSAGALASVALPGGDAEIRRFPTPACGAGAGWLRVEASGICGTDVALTSKISEPTILGHHVVGEIAELGPAAARSWGVAVGDRVVLEEYLPCGRCVTCRAGHYRLCPTTDLWRGGRRVGLVPVDEKPSLWGGNAEYVYLPENAVMHLLPASLDPEVASWTLPLANALDWVLGAGELRAGETVVIIGPGYHGLAAVEAAVQGGAGKVIICGRAEDRQRLALAEKQGAVVIDVSAVDVEAIISDVTEGRMADLVLDTAGSGPEAFSVAASLLGRFGRLIVAGAKNPSDAPIDTARLVRDLLVVRGVRGRSPESVRRSIDMLAVGASTLEHVPTHAIGLSDVGPMLRRLSEGSGPDTPHVVVRPGVHETDRTMRAEKR
jgi:threonine dehydrogenase-like Zn-dependent dehydrogenase